MIDKVKNTYKIFLLYFNTIKYLKISQIFFQIKFRLFKARKVINFDSNLKLKKCKKKFADTIKKDQSITAQNEFKFLNKSYVLSLEKDWDSFKIDKLWLYNLHYFDDLNAEFSKKRAIWHEGYFLNWINNFKKLKGMAWEPYPMSLRIVNWVKWYLQGGNLNEELSKLLIVQTRFLFKNIEFHILGNHVFANAKALIFAGVIFEGKEADRWFYKGNKIFKKELKEQILNDGGNFELSPMYHCIFLEDVLDIINLYKTYNIKFSSSLIVKVEKMFLWLESMSHPDGEISFFNDSAHFIAPNFEKLLSYANRLNLKLRKKNKTYIDFKDSGYCYISNKNMKVIIDRCNLVSSYQPGHSHSDILSFECSLFNKRLIVNSGISTYENNYERHLNRSSISHSCVVINQTNSTQVWSSFRVGSRANIIKKSKIIKIGENLTLSACHDGYKKFKGQPIHCRKWLLAENKLEVEDIIFGTERHIIEVIFILHPSVKIIKLHKDFVDLDFYGKKLVIQFYGNGEISCIDSYYNLSFNYSKCNKKIVFSAKEALPQTIRTKILW